MKNHILIIGGMGPQASLKFHQLLLAQANHNDPDQYPLIVHASLPIKDFISDKQHELGAILQINHALRKLHSSQANVVVIPCNTAHLLLPKLNLNKTDFVSIVDSVVDKIVKSQSKKVGILASPNTIKSKLYHSSLAKLGIETVEPTQQQQRILESIIRGVISQSDTQLLAKKLNSVISTFDKNIVDCLVIGCTELSTLKVNAKVPVIDSLEQLAESAMLKYSESRL